MGNIVLSGLGIPADSNITGKQNLPELNQVSGILNNKLNGLQLSGPVVNKPLPPPLNSDVNNLRVSDLLNVNQNNLKSTNIPANNFQNLSGGKQVYIHIIPTYGNEDEINVKGRVTEDKEEVAKASPNDSKIKNFFKNLGILRQEEIEKVNVDISFNGKTFQVQTDKEGYFDTQIKNFGPVKAGYNQVYVNVSAGQKYASAVSAGTVSIQGKNDSTYGIVTDIDDTIQKSFVPDKKQALKTLLFYNYTTQQEVAGTSELYQALDKSNDGKTDGDVYYISGSPNQISSRIENFLKYNQFPDGSLDLKRIGFGAGEDSPTKQIEYKIGKIRNLFSTYPEKKFLLFGDSGEKDPEIYRQISLEYPGRVIGIYINNVTGDLKNSPRYQGMMLTDSTADSANDLYRKGFISSQDLGTVVQQTAPGVIPFNPDLLKISR
jgi:phosphatidate phosphatase APP1